MHFSPAIERTKTLSELQTPPAVSGFHLKNAGRGIMYCRFENSFESTISLYKLAIINCGSITDPGQEYE
jgi:hypothetical protein